MIGGETAQYPFDVDITLHSAGRIKQRWFLRYCSTSTLRLLCVCFKKGI